MRNETETETDGVLDVEKFSNSYKISFCNGNLSSDFYKIMSYDKIIFGYRTLAWWAAALSGDSKVGVFEPWRPWKKENNKNLGKASYPGWFGWK